MHIQSTSYGEGYADNFQVNRLRAQDRLRRSRLAAAAYRRQQRMRGFHGHLAPPPPRRILRERELGEEWTAEQMAVGGYLP